MATGPRAAVAEILAQPQGSLAASASNSPGGNWSNYQLLHGGVLGGPLTAPSETPSLWEDFIKDFLPALIAFGDTIQRMFADFQAAWDDGQLSFDQVTARMANDRPLIIDMLDTVEKIVTGLLKFAADFLKWFEDGMNSPIDIPFIGGFLKWLYSEIADEELTLLNAFSLLVAIPGTIVYKLATGKAPQADAPLDLSKADYRQIFGGLNGSAAGAGRALQSAETAAAPRLRALAMEASEGAADKPAEESADSASARYYSYIGGSIAEVAIIIGRIINLVNVMTEEAEEVGEGTALLTVSKGPSKTLVAEGVITFIQLTCACPVGSDPEVNLQGGVWITGWIGGSLQIIASRWPMARGVVTGIKAIVKICLAIPIFVKENGHSEGTELKVDIIKFVENVLDFLADGGEAASNLVPKRKDIKGGLAGAAAGVSVIAGVLALVRLMDETTEKLAHQVH